MLTKLRENANRALRFYCDKHPYSQWWHAVDRWESYRVRAPSPFLAWTMARLKGLNPVAIHSDRKACGCRIYPDSESVH